MSPGASKPVMLVTPAAVKQTSVSQTSSQSPVPGSYAFVDRTLLSRFGVPVQIDR